MRRIVHGRGVAAVLVISFLLLVNALLILFMMDGVGFGPFKLAIIRLVQVIPVTFFIVCFLSERFHDPQCVGIRALIVASLIQCLISVIMFAYPEFRDWFLDVTRQEEYAYAKLQVARYRGYGLGSGLLYEYAVLQGMIAAIVILVSRVRNVFLLILLPLYVVSIILNARIGMVPVVLSAWMVIPMRLSRIDSRGSPFFVMTLLIIAAGIISYATITQWFPESIAWAEEGVREVVSPSGFSRDTTIEALTKSMSQPEGLAIVFGRGLDLDAQLGNQILYSDVGYVQDLYYGGIVYLGLNMALWFVLAFTAFNNGASLALRIFIVQMLVVLFVCHFKGSVSWSQAIIKLYWLICFSVLLRSRWMANVSCRNFPPRILYQ